MFEYNGSNYVHEIGDESYVSFNPNPCAGFNFWQNSGGNSETALVNKSLPFEENFLIIDGDFREEYETCTTYEEARVVFEKLKAEHGEGEWSRR
mgnify:CR=1 FL=1